MVVIVKLVEFNHFNLDEVMDFLRNHKGVQIVDSGFFVGRRQVLHAVNQMKKIMYVIQRDKINNGK